MASAHPGSGSDSLGCPLRLHRDMCSWFLLPSLDLIYLHSTLFFKATALFFLFLCSLILSISLSVGLLIYLSFSFFISFYLLFLCLCPYLSKSLLTYIFISLFFFLPLFQFSSLLSFTHTISLYFSPWFILSLSHANTHRSFDALLPPSLSRRCPSFLSFSLSKCTCMHTQTRPEEWERGRWWMGMVVRVRWNECQASWTWPEADTEFKKGVDDG